MLRRLLCRFAPWLIAGAFFLVPAPLSAQETDDRPKRSPALEYLLAVAFTVTVMVIVCKPSRKTLSDR